LPAGHRLDTPLFAAAAAIREKALEPFLIKSVQRKPVPVEPAAEILQEGTLLMHRLPSVTLTAEQCCKSIQMECQRANAGVLGSCRCVVVAIAIIGRLESSGEIPVGTAVELCRGINR